MKNISIIFCLFLYCINPAWAQIENKNLTPSPNAAGLGTFGQIDVDLFTGVPKIDIPLYTYKSRDISVPISLAYHPANIRPSDHASWVGLGWNLIAGGVITRTMNGLPDEFVEYHVNPNIQRGFFYNYSVLSSSTWTSTSGGSTLQTAYANFVNQWTAPNSSFAYNAIDYAPDEFQFNFMGMSGSIMMGQDGQWHLITKQGLNFKVQTKIGLYAVWEPNLNSQLPNSKNYPSLVRTCLTGFVLTAADGTQYSFGTDPASKTNNYNNSYLNGFFTTPDSAAVEFSRIGVGTGYGDTRDGGTVAVSWYLTKIQSPSGDVVTFRYTRDGPQIMMTTTAFGTSSQCNACAPNAVWKVGAGDNVTILDGCTLSGIYGANGSITFDKSIANILDWTINGAGNTPQDDAWLNPSTGMYAAYSLEIFQGYGNATGSGVKSAFMKLDKLNIKDNNNTTLKSYSFNYTTGTSNRLFLNSMTETGSDGTTLPPYSFTYNNIAGLTNVPYNTVQVDHWGYYTAADPFVNLFPTTAMEPTKGNPITNSPAWTAFYNTASSVGYNLNYTSTFNSTFNATYVANRAPVIGTMSYGILTQINYPTGGNTQFSWEPNYYSKYINGSFAAPVGYSFSVTDLGVNTSGPGSRIHQISSQANFNAPVVTKTYTYYRDYTHNNYTSSGVLNSAQPSYIDSYSGTYQGATYLYTDWSSNNVNATYYTNGAPITYSNVQELNSDGSYKTYTYSNHDNGYLDNTGSYYLLTQFPSNTPFIQSVNSNSLQLERGLLLSENTYALSSILQNSKTFTYNNDPTRTSTNIRRYLYDKKFSLDGPVYSFDGNGFLVISSGSPIYWGDITSALNVYIHYPYLSSVTDVQYDQSGANPVTQTTNYTYDGHRNKKSETMSTSTSANLVSNYNYAADAISGLSGSASAGQTAMVNASMYGIPLEKTTSKGGVQQEHTRLDFQTLVNTNSLVVPAVSNSAIFTNSLENQAQYVNYDAYGNILEFIPRNGVTNSFLWGYNQAYPIVKITNAANTFRNYTVPTQTTGTGLAQWNPGVFTAQQVPFTQAVTGTITLSFGLSSYLAGANVNLNYTLTGPSNQSGTLCSTTGGTCSYPSNVTFNNMPAGNYTFTFNINSNYSIGSAAQISYQTITQVPATSGMTEFFFDGFEENTNPNVTTGSAHTGNKYWNGSTYTTSYTRPNGRNYILQYWSLSGGSWVFHQQAYTGATTLTGPVDDIRIFPADAQMITYTYTPLVGMTSQTDPSGKSTIYQYDNFMRLQAIRDQYTNILKQFDYEYQVLNTPACNTVQSGTFTKTNCPNGYTGLPVTYTVAANTYCSIVPGAANQLAINDVNTNGQTYANNQSVSSACHLNAPTITGQTYFSSSHTSGSGTITGIPGATVKVTISAGGPPGNTYSISASINSGSLGSGSVSNGNYTFTFVMPASGSASWSANYSYSNTSGSGSISVSY
jgi:hypothetical protein